MSRLLSIVSTYSALFVNVFAVDRPKCTPRRRLLLGDAENNSSTPILSMKSFSRSGSSESGNTSSQFEMNAVKSCCNLDWVIFYFNYEKCTILSCFLLRIEYFYRLLPFAGRAWIIRFSIGRFYKVG